MWGSSTLLISSFINFNFGFFQTAWHWSLKPLTHYIPLSSFYAEAIVQRCSIKKVFLEISQNWQENTCASLYFNEVAGMVFQEKYFWCYIPLTDQISLSSCFYFLRYWVIFALLFFRSACYAKNFEIDFSFLIKPFFCLTKK